MSIQTFTAPDYYQLDDVLTEEQKLIRDSIRNWVSEKVIPIIDEHCQKATFPVHLIKEMAQLGVFGPTLPQEYGGGGLDNIAYGLIMQELERGDSGIRSMASVQSSLVMYPIFTYASEEQKKKWLPKLASAEAIGCFGLTEPDYGSNPSGMITNFKDKGKYVVLNGAKMWITNGTLADVAVVWAKDEKGIIRGLLVEKGMKGFTAPEMKNKWSLRASVTSELIFQDVEVPKENIFPNVQGLKGPLGCLTQARYGIAWGALGAAMACYDTALQYAKGRIQFDRPIAGFQLTQKKFAEFITEITKGQLLAYRLAVLKNEGKMRPQQVSMAKRNNVDMALAVAREARQILGANGIMGEYPIMRHMMNMESVITYEGTHDIHTLVLGEDVTGIAAYK